MSGRVTKFALMLVLAAIFAILMVVLAGLMLLLPVVALIAPGVIDLKTRGDK